jgi:hypothetical protein
MGPKTSIKSKIVFAGSLGIMAFALIGCGKGFQTRSASEMKVFTDENSKSGYRVLLERPKFIESADLTAKDAKSKSDSKLAALIKNIRLDMADEDSTKLKLRVVFSSGPNLDFSANLLAQPNAGFIFYGPSDDGQFDIKGSCIESFCDHASFIMTEASSGKLVQVDYSRSTEYLKPEDLGRIRVSKEDKELLSDVIEYRLPITRHAAKVAGRSSKTAIVDLLIVARPEVDTGQESFDDDGGNAAGAPETPDVSQPQSPVGKDEHVIELEATSEDTDVSPNTQSTTPDEPKSTNSGKKDSHLILTSNPYEVYDIKFPAERLKNLNVRNPLIQLASFEIVPAEQQRTYEPAFRIAVIAEAFVEQRVKIYLNACNIFVRSVMTLAGYTKGKSYNANEFGQLFKTKGQGLDQWDKFQFTRNGSSALDAANSGSLQATLNGLPEAHGTVAQWIRPGRHGHIGIVTRLDGVVYFIDGSLGANQRGLKKTPVKAIQLLNDKSRKELNMYGIKGIMRNGQRSI